MTKRLFARLCVALLAFAPLASKAGGPPAAMSPSPIPARNVLKAPHLLFRTGQGIFTNAGSTNQTYSTLNNLDSPPMLARVVYYNDQTGASLPIGASYISPTTSFGAHADDGYNAYNGAGAQDNTMGVQITFNNGCSPNYNWFNQPSGSTTTATIAAATASGQPTACYSDWVKVNGLPRIDGGPGALLLVRTYSGASGTNRYQGAIAPFLNSPSTGLFAKRAAFGAWQSGNSAAFSTWSSPPVFAFGTATVEYVPQGAGISILGVGDSILKANGSTGSAAGPGVYAAVNLTSSAFPVSYFSEAYSGRTTADFIANGYADVLNLKPQIVLIQMWSENDNGTTVAQAQAAFQSGMQLAQIVKANGGVPIITTAAPVLCGNSTLEVNRAASNALVRSASAAGMLMLDMDAILGTGASPNCYQSAYNSGDNTHPNDAGNAAMGAVLTSLIQSNVLR